MALDPKAQSPENQESEEVPTSIAERKVDLVEKVRSTNDILAVAPKPPMPFIAMTERFYTSHAIEDPEEQKKLAVFTIGFDPTH